MSPRATMALEGPVAAMASRSRAEQTHRHGLDAMGWVPPERSHTPTRIRRHTTDTSCRFHFDFNAMQRSVTTSESSAIW